MEANRVPLTNQTRAFSFPFVFSPLYGAIPHPFIDHHSLTIVRSNLSRGERPTSITLMTTCPPSDTDAPRPPGLSTCGPSTSKSLILTVFYFRLRQRIRSIFYSTPHYVTARSPYALRNPLSVLAIYRNTRRQRALNPPSPPSPPDNNFSHQPPSIPRRFSTRAIFNSSSKIHRRLRGDLASYSHSGQPR